MKTEKHDSTILSASRAPNGLSENTGSIPAVSPQDIQTSDSSTEVDQPAPIAPPARTSRRGFLMNSIVSSASLMTAIPIAGALPAQSDADLIQMGVRLAEVKRDLDAIGDHTTQDEVDAIDERLRALVPPILAHSATTIGGLGVQAAAATLACADLWQGNEHNEGPLAAERPFIEAVCRYTGIVHPIAVGIKQEPAEQLWSPEEGSQSAPDPIYAAIEAHRDANAEYEKACDAPGKMLGHPRRARVYLGQRMEKTFSRPELGDDGVYSVRFEPTGKKIAVFAYDLAGIKNHVPDDLKGPARDAWIAERSAELEKDEDNVRRRWAKTKLGRLEAIRDAAEEVERDRMWDLIWTQPTTLAGLAALLAYCSVTHTERGCRLHSDTITDSVHCDDGWQEALEWTMEAAVCALAGLPEPPMSELVAELAGDEDAA